MPDASGSQSTHADFRFAHFPKLSHCLSNQLFKGFLGLDALVVYGSNVMNRFFGRTTGHYWHSFAKWCFILKESEPFAK